MANSRGNLAAEYRKLAVSVKLPIVVPLGDLRSQNRVLSATDNLVYLTDAGGLRTSWTSCLLQRKPALALGPCLRPDLTLLT